MVAKLISKNIFDCSTCNSRCDGISKGIYDFERDVNFSEEIENKIISLINSQYSDLFAFKTKKNGYPDIEIISKQSITRPIAFIEVKVQSRTFMSIEKYLPSSNLKPSETIALNLSDLERYFEISKNEKTPFHILWCLKNRKCINEENKNIFYHQEISVLENIRKNDINNFRKFKRASGKGDIVDGVHKGVLVNYHFSLNELLEGIPNLK